MCHPILEYLVPEELESVGGLAAPGVTRHAAHQMLALQLC
jgi:hypothetical protein